MVTDVTSICAPKISNFLKKNSVVSTLRFPSLSRLIYAYHPSDYVEAGRVIGQGKVEIYRSHTKGLANYQITGDSCITLYDDIGDDNRNGVVVHEVTHMVQDMRRMRFSILEMELDAYFAEALYYVRRNNIKQFQDSKPLMISIHMAAIAESFDKDEKYIKTKDFRTRRGKCGKEIADEYWYRHGVSNVGKRFRNDGLQL